jgi:hypothetical protein
MLNSITIADGLPDAKGKCEAQRNTESQCKIALFDIGFCSRYYTIFSGLNRKSIWYNTATKRSPKQPEQS